MAILNGDSIDNILVGTNGSDTLAGLGGDDVLAGGLGDDRLEGGNGDDVLGGGDGDDELVGGTGQDVMVGGNGNDLYYVDHSGDMVVETDSDGGIDIVISSVSHTLGDHVEGIILSGNANLNANGNSLDNGLMGNAGDNQMFGLGGNDLFFASLGNDLMNGGMGQDTVDYSDMSQSITLSAQGVINKGNGMGTDQVQDVEVIIGAANQFNLIDASSSFNSPVSIRVNLAQESLIVQGIPQTSDQSFQVVNFVDVIGTSQADDIVGDSADNWLWGAGGNDFLSGGTGNDSLYGGLGDDTLSGGSGSDYLVGYDFSFGGEIDYLTGGTGTDYFVLGDSLNGSYYLESLSGNLDYSYAVITDWNSSADYVQLSSGFQYTLSFQSYSGIGSNATDAAILLNGNIVAILADSTSFNFNSDVLWV